MADNEQLIKIMLLLRFSPHIDNEYDIMKKYEEKLKNFVLTKPGTKKPFHSINDSSLIKKLFYAFSYSLYYKNGHSIFYKQQRHNAEKKITESILCLTYQLIASTTSSIQIDNSCKIEVEKLKLIIKNFIASFNIEKREEYLFCSLCFTKALIRTLDDKKKNAFFFLMDCIDNLPFKPLNPKLILNRSLVGHSKLIRKKIPYVSQETIFLYIAQHIDEEKKIAIVRYFNNKKSYFINFLLKTISNNRVKNERASLTDYYSSLLPGASPDDNNQRKRKYTASSDHSCSIMYGNCRAIKITK